MMFRPRESHDLRLRNVELTISRRVPPACDGFTTFSIIRWRSLLSIAPPRSFVSTAPLNWKHVETSLGPDYPLEDYAQTYPFSYSKDERPDLLAALTHHYPSDGVRRWVEQFLNQREPIETISLLRSVALSIRQDFSYTRRSEKGVQSPDETLQSRCGSCRDFAVLMMEAVRSLGLAARFVSGYIFTPNSGVGEIRGHGATHAWMQTYLPGAGWMDFDPTNSIIGNRNLIRVAVAWDPKQVLPLWGTFTGSPSAFQGMEVTVSVVETVPAMLR